MKTKPPKKRSLVLLIQSSMIFIATTSLAGTPLKRVHAIQPSDDLEQSNERRRDKSDKGANR
jgi:hypothetical protein